MCALAVEVDGDDGAGQFAGLFEAVGDCFAEQVGIHVPRKYLAVDKDRDCAFVEDGVGACGESQGRANDLIAALDSDETEGEVDGGSSGGEGGGALSSDDGGELAFEGIDVRAEWGDPVRVERIDQQFAFIIAHVGS